MTPRPAGTTPRRRAAASSPQGVSKQRKQPYTLANFASFCKGLVLENGKRMVLEPHERTVLRDYFEGAVETVILIPKKNGKSSLLAALALYHLVRIPEAECLIGASSRDQATLIFNQAAGLVRRSGLEDVYDVKGGYRHIRHEEGRIRVLASGADHADGVIPTLALVDELHRHPSSELYDVFRDGLGPRGGRMVTISTAGATMASPLGRIRTEAHELPTFVRDEERKYNYAYDAEGKFAFHEWCLSDDDDPADLALVKLVNPASWQTLAELHRRQKTPSMTAWSWLRFACGVWTEGEEPWIEPAKWDGCADADIEISEGDTVYIGVDVEARKGDAAVVLVRPIEDSFWVKAEMRQQMSVGEAEDRVRELAKQYSVQGVVYMDRAFERSADMLDDEGIRMLMLPDAPKRKEQVAATLFKVIEEGRLRHDGDTELRAQVLAGRVKESESGWRFVKDPTLPRPINALVALAAALHVAETDKPIEPLFAWT